MPLFADRFITNAPLDDDNAGYALDLASRQRVRIDVASAGSAAEQREWLLACEDRLRVCRLFGPRLLDYGLVGETRRFEAWIDEGPRAGSKASEPANATAISLIERPATSALAALFEPSEDRRVRVAACWGPEGSGRATVVEQLARIARLRGFTPIDATLLQDSASLLSGRMLFVIDAGDRGRADGSSWLVPVLRAPRAHVCLLMRSEEVRGVDGFGLDRIPSEALAEAVVSPSGDALFQRRVRRAAEKAYGLPGRFIQLLCPGYRRDMNCPRRSGSRVAEQPAVYGNESDGDIAVARAQSPIDVRVRSWPAPGELVALRRRSTTAVALVDAGRYAPGVRGLRQTMAAFARRDAWTDAFLTALTLSAALLDRARVREAQRVLADARDWVGRAGDSSALVDVAILTGTAWIDLARLDEAERVLSGALAAAKATADRARIAVATTALGRCLFWRGEYADAAASLATLAEDGRLENRIRQYRTLARAAAAQGDSTQALPALEAARALAGEPAGGRWMSDVDYTAACVRLAFGDLDGVDREVAACVTRAKEHRRPLRAVTAQLLQAEVDRRRGRTPDAVRWAALRRLVTAASPLTRVRFDLLRAMVEAPDDRAILRRQMSATGLKGLEVFGSSLPRIPGSRPPSRLSTMCSES